MVSKRLDLLNATKSLLLEVGYESMSPKKVLSKSGAGQGSLYHHFKSKKELAFAALSEIEVEMRDSFDQIFKTDKTPFEQIIDYLNLQRNGLAGCRLGRLANEQSISDKTLNKPVSRYFKYVENIISDKLEEAINNQEIVCSAPPCTLASTLIATVQGGYTLSRIMKNPMYIDQATKGAVIMLKAMTPKKLK